MQDFKKLQAWQKAHLLVLRTYAISAYFPEGERFGLTAQMRRAAVSVPANIAEGCCRGGDVRLHNSCALHSVRPVNSSITQSWQAI